VAIDVPRRIEKVWFLLPTPLIHTPYTGTSLAVVVRPAEEVPTAKKCAIIHGCVKPYSGSSARAAVYFGPPTHMAMTRRH
jgi:hypothetical protein